jgi:hypothetical protein
MKYLFLLLLCCTANASTLKFHFGDKVSFRYDDFYGNCNGVVTGMIGTDKYNVTEVECNYRNVDVDNHYFSADELQLCLNDSCIYYPKKKGKKK